MTHFCVMAANYLTAVAGERAAVLEWNESGAMERMELVCTGKVRPEKPFQVLGTDYYKAAGARELASCLDRYRYVLVDFGVIGDRNRDEFLRCERRVLIGSFCEWQPGAFWEYVRQGKRADRSWECAAAFGSGETRREVSRGLRVPVLEIPLSADAFTVTPVTLEFFQAFFLRQ